MSQETSIKIGFTSHDHKEVMDIEDVNTITKQIDEPVTITELKTFSDEYAFAIHNCSTHLLELFPQETFDKMWLALEPFRYGDYDDCDELTPYIKGDILVIPIDVLKTYVETKG